MYLSTVDPYGTVYLSTVDLSTVDLSTVDLTTVDLTSTPMQKKDAYPLGAWGGSRLWDPFQPSANVP